MKELIKIQTNEVGENCVSARELHEGLGNKRQFTDWIKQRITRYSFEENIDYIKVSLVSQNCEIKTGRGGDTKSVDYIITVDMAKELCMVENNELGRKFRKYFIEAEKKLKEIKEIGNKQTKHYEKKLYNYSTSPLLMDNIPGDSLVLNFLNNSTRKETEAIINKTGIKATFFAKQLNISDSNMCSWRKNEINFNEDKINNLLKVLDTIKGILLLE